MEVHVDYNPSPKDHFFISVHLSDKVAISFDNTIKGQRIIKQVFKEHKEFPLDAKFNSEWNTIVIKDGKFVREYHVKWIDQDKLDWLNGELWETVWERPISQELTDNLLYYSQLISDNYKGLHKVLDSIKRFEELLSKEVLQVP